MTKETIKHLVFDLDGTIVFDGKAIEASLLEPLRQLQKKVSSNFCFRSSY
ncbi:hypothetical protein [Streptococcus uberis]|nr:hypothetical protein [Streptococcus uberis]MCK1234295.1 hypothetical protein [Streptococcus uberis]